MKYVRVGAAILILLLMTTGYGLAYAHKLDQAPTELVPLGFAAAGYLFADEVRRQLTRSHKPEDDDE